MFDVALVVGFVVVGLVPFLAVLNLVGVVAGLPVVVVAGVECKPVVVVLVLVVDNESLDWSLILVGQCIHGRLHLVALLDSTSDTAAQSASSVASVPQLSPAPVVSASAAVQLDSYKRIAPAAVCPDINILD